MGPHTIYNLNTGVQVRGEVFGLLFYNYKGPRLYFVPSKDLIEPDFFDGQKTLGDLIGGLSRRHAWPEQWISDRVHQVLGVLEEKGLIHGQSVC
jgi:putative mycofactocin binding protein MftB